MNPPPIKSGDAIRLACGGSEVDAMVLLASENSRSLLCTFDGAFRGYVGAMPLLWDGAGFRELVQGRSVRVQQR